MALRLVEILLPADRAHDVSELLENEPNINPWQESLADGRLLLRLVVDAEHTRSLVDHLSERFSSESGLQILILPVAATIPRIPDPEEDAAKEQAESKAASEVALPGRRGLSREELHHQVEDMTKLSWVYVAAVVLSSIVASVGMLRDNVAAIIGAMVIAPLLGPNVALAFSASIGEAKLMQQALRTSAVGVSISLAMAAALGLVLTVDPSGAEIAGRTQVGLSDVALALASGSAGALAITTGVPAALVGVMVAVALLPPTIALGLMLGSGHWALAGSAGLLLATNIICVNLAGIATFLAQGIRPRTWWEAERAKRGAVRALVFWLIALTGLIVLIVITSRSAVPDDLLP